MDIRQADLLDETEGVLLHGVNCQGVMNAGIAKQIRQRYPQVYRDYLSFRAKALCSIDTLDYPTPQHVLLGQIVITPIHDRLYIVSGFTQLDCGRDHTVRYVDYSALQQVFQKASAFAQSVQLPLKFPKIGAGLANGEWSVIRELIVATEPATIPYLLFTLD